MSRAAIVMGTPTIQRDRRLRRYWWAVIVSSTSPSWSRSS
jgi:hypothetical protein